MTDTPSFDPYKKIEELERTIRWLHSQLRTPYTGRDDLRMKEVAAILGISLRKFSDDFGKKQRGDHSAAPDYYQIGHEFFFTELAVLRFKIARNHLGPMSPEARRVAEILRSECPQHSILFDRTYPQSIFARIWFAVSRWVARRRLRRLA